MNPVEFSLRSRVPMLLIHADKDHVIPIDFAHTFQTKTGWRFGRLIEFKDVGLGDVISKRGDALCQKIMPRVIDETKIKNVRF